MRITKRIAEEQYCYTEVEFESLEEYKTEYPKFAKVMKETKERAKQSNPLPDPFAFQKSLEPNKFNYQYENK
jgi:hypothetical protein